MENVIIIGGGPAGLAAAIYTARAGFSPLVFAGSPPGGQLMLTSQVENYPGFESILGPQLIEKMRQQAQKFGARVLDENVVKVDFSQRPFKIYLYQDTSPEVFHQITKAARHHDFLPTSPPPSGGSPKSLAQNQVSSPLENFDSPSSSNSSQNFISSLSVIIATGAKALWLNVPGEQQLRGRGVSACATCDGFFFREKVVAVVGGGDSAMEEALTLTKFAKKVYIIHRRGEFRASKIMQERVFANPKIEVIWNAVVEEVLGEEKVEGVKLRRQSSSGYGNEARIEKRLRSSSPTDDTGFLTERRLTTDKLKLDGLFVAIGHKPDTDIFAGQIEMDEKGYVVTSARKAIDDNKFLINLISNYSKQIPNPNTQKKEIGKLDNGEIGDYLDQLGIRNFNFNYQSMTSVEGVFAAGDCVDFAYRQAGVAAGMGIVAALEVERWLEKK